MPEVTLRGGEVDGLTLHYVVEGRGPAVVLLHGLGGFAESWRHTIAALAPRARVYALDLPGFGRSAKPPGPYRLPSFAAAVHGFLNAMGLGQAALVGHSLGGAVAVTCALIHPVRVERLALIGSIVPGVALPQAWGMRLLAVPGLGELLGLCARPRHYKAAVARCFHQPVRDEIDFLVDHDHATRAAGPARAAWLATARGLPEELVRRQPAYRRALATLDHPLLLVHGRQDPAVPAAHVVEAASVLPRAELRWVERCGHFPMLECPRAVHAWLGEFLAGRPVPR